MYSKIKIICLTLIVIIISAIILPKFIKIVKNYVINLINKSKNKKEQEKKRKEEIKKQINIRQFNLRKNKQLINEKKNDNIELIKQKGEAKGLSYDEIKREIDKAQILEDMSTMGTIMKEEIIEEKKTNPEKFYSDKEIVNNKSNGQLYALGIFSKVLENQGTVTAIEKNINKKDTNSSLQTSMQFLVNGMSNKTKYDLHFDLGEDKNNKLLEDEEERKKFNDKLRKKLSKEFNINEEDILITFPREGTYQVTIIFKSADFNLSETELLKKFPSEKEGLGKLKKIGKGIILDGCKLSPDLLDYRGNNKDGGWAPQGEKRGNEKYIPPIGWTGYGLKVSGIYENDTWLGMNNCPGEWCVAYHGVARGQDPNEVANITGNIYRTKFKPSTWGKATDDNDLRHPGRKCGLGVYCSPNPAYAEMYAGITEFNGERYKCALMLRINPQKIRQSANYPEEYILEPTTDDIRPYRILLKKC